MAILPPSRKRLPRPREIHRIQGVLVLLQRKQRLQSRHMRKCHIPSSKSEQKYESAAAKVLLLLSPVGRHLS